MELIKEKIPGYINDARKSLSLSFEQFRNQDSYYLNQDVLANIDINYLIASKYNQEVSDALKFIIGSVFKENEESRVHFPKVLQSLQKDDYEIKTLGYYIYDEMVSRNLGEPQNDMVILSICSILRDFMSIKNYLKLVSLKAISSAYSRNMSDTIDELINKATKDKSVLVRRMATIGMYKIATHEEFDHQNLGHILEFLKKSMGDFLLNSGLSIIVYFKLTRGEDLSFLHPHFRTVGSNLKYYPETESPTILNLLHRYAIKYLISANGDKSDLNLLKSTGERLLFINNPCLFLEGLKFFMRLNDKAELKKGVKGGIRFLHSTSEIKFIFLEFIETIGEKYPDLFTANYNDFFVYYLEKTFTSLKKIDILVLIGNNSNSSVILEELNSYIHSPNEKLAKAAIRAIGKIWSKLKTLKKNMLIILLKSKSFGNKSLNEEIIVSISKFIEKQNTKEEIEAQAPMIAMLTTSFIELENPFAQKALFGQFFKFLTHLPGIMTELLKRISEGFELLSPEIKLIALRFNLSLLLSQDDNFKYFDYICAILLDLLEKGIKDIGNYSLNQSAKNIARFLSGFDPKSHDSSKGTPYKLELSNIRAIMSAMKQSEDARSMFTKKIHIPGENTEALAKDNEADAFESMDKDSLSNIIGKFLKGYVDFPDEAIVEDTTNLRDKNAIVINQDDNDSHEGVLDSDKKGASVSPLDLNGNPSQSTNRKNTDEISESQLSDEIKSPTTNQVRTLKDIKKDLDAFFDE